MRANINPRKSRRVLETSLRHVPCRYDMTLFSYLILPNKLCECFRRQRSLITRGSQRPSNTSPRPTRRSCRFDEQRCLPLLLLCVLYLEQLCPSPCPVASHSVSTLSTRIHHLLRLSLSPVPCSPPYVQSLRAPASDPAVSPFYSVIVMYHVSSSTLFVSP